MNSRALSYLSLLFLGAVLFGCSSRTNHSPFPTISDEAKADIAKPINCATAEGDIQILKEEKASVGKQMLSGVRAILPIAVVAGILMGDYSDRASVAVGKYNRDIEAKIKEIKETCGIPVGEDD